MEIFIKVVFTGLISFILGYFINKSSLKEIDSLSYNNVSKILALILLVISLIFFTFLIFEESKPNYFIIFLVLSFLIFSIYLSIDTFTTFLTYNKEKIIFYSIWNGKRKFFWNDVTRIQFHYEWKWYILTFKNKDKIRLSLYLRGSNLMVQHLESLGLELELI
jgi:hypothetical protein